MKLGLAIGLLTLGGAAEAGGLFLPGSGAVSTSRAGASVVAADDGEAIALNPAGIAKAKGTTITFGIAAVDYYLQFTRAGNYPDLSSHESTTYANTPYPTMTNDAHPPLGFGPFQPIPMIAVVTDLGGAVPNMHFAAGLYAPNAYPFRDFTKVNGHTWVFNSDIEAPPPPTRYDIMNEEAAIILPSIAAAYSVTPTLDLGARLSAGIGSVKSTIAVWGLQNHEEWQQQDGTFTLDAKGFVWNAQFGANFRPTPEIEVGASYTLPINVHAQGDATNQNGPAVNIGGAAVIVTPVPDDAARCAKGGTMASLKGCVDFELPMHAEVGGRYKFLEPGTGKLKGDIEVDLGWEKWGTECQYKNADGSLTGCQNPSDFRVVVDGAVGTQTSPGALLLHDNIVSHGFQDVYNLRIGGSWVFPMNTEASVVARGGISYDSAAAKSGWERLDVDGAARTMVAAGGSYKTKKFSVDAGFGFIYEGTRTQNRGCTVTGLAGSDGCGPGGTEQNIPGWSSTGPFRAGPDPINPIVNADVQAEHPVNEGTYNSHYILLMLGMSTWF
jgi:long-subunit fatty acid transport protein